MHIDTGLATLLSLFLIGAAVDAHAAVPADRIGAVFKHDKTICLRIANAHLAPKTRLLLVDPDGTGGTAGAEVAGPAAACGQDHQRGYALRTTDEKVHGGAVLFGLLAPPDAVAITQGSSVVTFGQDHLALHACASVDGVHLTVWRDRPLNGPRLWHDYVYLGQDLEPDCQDKETS
jgi:hypothetical protein